jgi:hypothetical protein
MRTMSFVLLLALVLDACAVSSWQQHSLALDQARANNQLGVAVKEQRWLIDHAFRDAPKEQRTRQAEVDRYLSLADLTARAGQTDETIETLRLALQTDPSRHQAIMDRLAALPLPPKERKHVEAEFRWNIMVLLPNLPPPADDLLPCWPYRVKQIRVHRTEVRQGMEGAQRLVSYDARSWVYNPDEDAWYADGNWFDDIGGETEPLNGPPRPRYEAIAAANGGYFSEAPPPPCHRHRWSSPYDKERDRLFVTRQLPGEVR